MDTGVAGSPTSPERQSADKAERFVAVVAAQQIRKLLLFARLKAQWHLTQLLAQKCSKRVLPALQVGEAAIGLELQSLLQGRQPGLQRWGQPVALGLLGWAVE